MLKSIYNTFKKEEFTTIFERIKKEQARLRKQIQDLQVQLSTLPEGKLICCQHGAYKKWYISDGHQKTYIPKAQHILTKHLALRKYLALTLDDLLQEEKALDYYLNHRSHMQRTEQWMTEHPEVSPLLSNYFKQDSPELSSWITSEYEHNPNYPEQLIHKTTSGNLVRSKSEAMIDTFLYKNKIPFRYECALHLGEIILYPDFTIKHPQTGELFYWEHFGRMDDPSYSKNAYSKLQLYNSHGIVPSIHLITTYETKENPLSTEVIEKIIEHYFL